MLVLTIHVIYYFGGFDRYGSSAQPHQNSFKLRTHPQDHRCTLLHAKRSTHTARNMLTIVT